jgi:MFS family permease
VTTVHPARRDLLRNSRAVAIRRWAIAVLVYFLAVFHRTSLGVAGLQASERFHVGPSELSVFVLLQLGVYAGMQIPTGILVDRYGPRRLLIVAAMSMGLAQLVFAVAGSFPMALLARGVLGAGDALTFVSVLRFAAGQFAPSRYPVVVSITGMLGAFGNLAATLPLSTVLAAAGWTPTFAVAAVGTLLAGLGVYVVLPAPPQRRRGAARPTSLPAAARSVTRRVRTAWSMPGTRAGFWVHFTSMSTAVMFGVLWGVPFMVQSQGMSRAEASTVLFANVLFSVLASPAIGIVTGRFRAARIPLAISVCAITIASWFAVLALCSGPIPRAVLVALVVFTSVGGPVSAIGFSLARDYNGPAIVGTATGVVNVAGFVGGILASLTVGAALGLTGTTRADYRLAFALAVGVQAVGLVEMVHWWLRARRASLREQERGRDVPVPVVRHRWDLD